MIVLPTPTANRPADDIATMLRDPLLSSEVIREHHDQHGDDRTRKSEQPGPKLNKHGPPAQQTLTNLIGRLVDHDREKERDEERDQRHDARRNGPTAYLHAHP